MEWINVSSDINLPKPKEGLRNTLYKYKDIDNILEIRRLLNIKEKHILFLYNSDYNPQKLKSPTPRPDFAIMDEGKVVKLVDAKYKDLWNNRISSDMLYQLAIYAISGTGNKTATILYPSVNDIPSVQKIDIKNPVSNVKIGEVILQTINLVKIASFLSDDKRELGRYIDSLLL